VLRQRWKGMSPEEKAQYRQQYRGKSMQRDDAQQRRMRQQRRERRERQLERRNR